MKSESWATRKVPFIRAGGLGGTTEITRHRLELDFSGDKALLKDLLLNDKSGNHDDEKE